MFLHLDQPQDTTPAWRHWPGRRHTSLSRQQWVQRSGYAAHRSVAWGKKTFTRKRFHKIKYTCLFQGHKCDIAKQGQVEPITAGSMLGHGTQLLREKPVSYSLKLERTQGKFQYKQTSHIGQGPAPRQPLMFRLWCPMFLAGHHFTCR